MFDDGRLLHRQHNAALQAELEGLRNLASVSGDVLGDKEVRSNIFPVSDFQP